MRKEKKLFLGRTSFVEQGTCNDFVMHAHASFFLWEMERNHLTHNLIAADQTVPDWLIKITFLRK